VNLDLYASSLGLVCSVASDLYCKVDFFKMLPWDNIGCQAKKYTLGCGGGNFAGVPLLSHDRPGAVTSTGKSGETVDPETGCQSGDTLRIWGSKTTKLLEGAGGTGLIGGAVALVLLISVIRRR
jgi:hypothetical protein